jgi:DNA-directed RNA polymerase subunit RPC12/RpoP
MLVCNRCGLTINDTNSYLSNNHCSNCGALLNPPTTDTRNVLCKHCGESARPGRLYGETELTMVMSDIQEERFIHAFACIKCGSVQLIIDYETEVVEDPDVVEE